MTLQLDPSQCNPPTAAQQPLKARCQAGSPRTDPDRLGELVGECVGSSVSQATLPRSALTLPEWNIPKRPLCLLRAVLCLPLYLLLSVYCVHTNAAVMGVP